MALLLKNQPSKIVGVQFSLMSPEEIRKGSVAEITNRNTYAGKKPVLGGLFTPQCGGGDITGNTKQICPTDGLTSVESPGYFGHLELTVPLFSMHNIKTIVKVRKTTCFMCSRLLFSKDKHQHMMDMQPHERMDYAYSLCKKIRRCGTNNDDGCGHRQPDKYELKSIASLFAVWEKVPVVAKSGSKMDDKKTVRLYPEMVLKQFKRITDEDMVFLGLSPVWSRPEWMILTVLPIGPPAIRPSVKPDSQQRSEDDLTHIYSYIVRTNQDLRVAIQENKEAHVIDQLRLMLQFLVASLVSNKIKGASPMTQRSGRPLQNICSRMNTKHGRIRGNLMGKRVNFSARSVITGDPNLSIRELGVPLDIAKNITKPIVVNARNRDFLAQLVRNGPSVYPGAKILERKGFEQTSGGGNQISLRYVDRESLRLELGDVVHRHLMDGDFVLFNRQPSLHRMSMMAHQVRVMKYGHTFRFNVGDTPPYNADFDGDEMNMHAPQSVQAELELQYLPAIPWQIVSPAKNSPVIGIFQDSLLGSYYFTRPHVRLSLLHAMKLLAQYSKLTPQLLKQMAKKDKATGEWTVSSFDVLSQIMPPMTAINKTNLFDDDKDKFATSNAVVEIQNGHYIRGQLEKSMFASTSKGILHRICNDFGNRVCADFIDDIQNIINEYMKTSSFSVGISDLISNKTTQQEIRRVIETQKQEVQLLIEKVRLGIFENNSANNNATEFELKVNDLLNSALAESGKIARKSLGADNRFVMIVNSGSKGSLHNISQMISCFGQQNIDGKRIPNSFDNRPLPHFWKYDDSPKARGFIENSYITGLTAVEVFYHAMGGRIGLIDTAVKSVTWETPIIILDKGTPKYVQIGCWIDGLLSTAPIADIQTFPDQANMELLNIGSGSEHNAENQLTNADKVFIPTTDEEGNISWGEITAITRHDPGNQLYEIKTQSGRTVIVTESKSLLIWNIPTQTFVETPTPEIIAGDFVPTTAKLYDPPIILTQLVSSSCSDFVYTLDAHNGENLGNYYGILNHSQNNPSQNLQPPTLLLPDWVLSQITSDHLLEALYVCSEECAVGFIRGFISAYSAVDIESVGGQSYNMISGSQTFLEDMNIVLSRLGAFGSISSFISVQEMHTHYKLTIMAKWANPLFVRLSIGCRCSGASEENPYQVVGDVVLDKIVEINLVDPANYPKMYDLTIPSTLNFGLANGLQVRDTSQTGYIQRRWVKAMEDLVVRYDMTVRNNMGKIIQFKYGDDGFDPVKVERQNLPLLTYSVQDIFDHYDIVGINEQKAEEIEVYTKGAHARLQEQREEAKKYCLKLIQEMAEMRDFIVEKVFRRKDENSVKIPVMFKNIIDNIQGQLGLGKMVNYVPIAQKFIQSNQEREVLTTATDLTPLECFRLVDEYYDKIERLGNAGPNPMFKTLYYFYLTPKTLLVEKRFHRKALEQLLETVVLKYKQAIVHPGETVGIIAGQSAGELSTQASLNSFHTAAGKQKKTNMTTGVPRIEELLQLTKTPKTPSLTIFLKPNDETDHERAKAVSLMLEYTKLSKLVRNVRILFDPQDDTIPEDTNIIRRFKLFEEMVQNCNSNTLFANPGTCDAAHSSSRMTNTDDGSEDEQDALETANVPLPPNRSTKTKKSTAQLTDDQDSENSKWVIRVEMDQETMLDKNITMDDVAFALNYYNDSISCVYSDYNDSQLVFRIKITKFSEIKKAAGKNKKILDKTDEIYILKQFMTTILENTVLRGVAGITNVSQRNIKDMVYKDDGKYKKKDIWIIDTAGSNLMDVLGLDYIDSTRTYSNNIREVAEVLGIHAAGQVLAMEFAEVLPDINNHHLSIIVDKMISLKDMCPVFRSGIFSDNVGPLMKSSFEMHSEVLMNAARHAEFDNARGISASVMLGQPGYFGTSSFQVLLDMREMEKLKTAKAILTKDRDQALAEGFGDLSKEIADDYCSKPQITIENHLNLLPSVPDLHGAISCVDDYDMGF